MNTYKVQVKTPDNVILWITVKANSMWEAEQLCQCHGKVKQVVAA